MLNKVDVFSKMTEDMKRVLDKQEELSQSAFATDVGFSEMRENYIKERTFWNEGGPDVTKIVNDYISGPHGEIPVRYYYPIENDNMPAIIYIHGGGFVVGSLDTHDRIMRIIANKTKAVVVGVDYKLSPEAKFPVALEECVAVAEYIHENGSNHSIDGQKIVFAGDSGGANLSFAANLYLRDEKKDNSYIKGMLLYYGAYGLKDSISMRLLGGPWDGLTKSDLDYYYDCYIRNEDDKESKYFNCFNADLSYGIPPSYIASAELDPLIDDSKLLANIMKNSGQTYLYEEFTGVIHAFLHHSRILKDAELAMENGAKFIKEYLYK